MTKTLYLMRHGQTLFNKRHRIQGWCDAPLTDLGVYQAQVAGQYFKNAGITFDAAYSSTSERACDTLEIVTMVVFLISELKASRNGILEPLKEKVKTSILLCHMKIFL